LKRSDTLIVLIAPNVSEQLGGEAMKALNIYRAIGQLHPNVIQITHVRNRTELKDRLKIASIHYVPDTIASILIWYSFIFRWALNAWFSYKAIRLAEKLVDTNFPEFEHVIFHQTEPNSALSPRCVSRTYKNVFGPVNGNIYYPQAFRSFESFSVTCRRLLHMPAASLHRLFLKKSKDVDLILCAGGARTQRSLEACGYRPEIITPSLDSGVSDRLLARPRIIHEGINRRVLHFGRLVFHKGTSLLIESLTKTIEPICLDIVGKGPELENCRKLVRALGLTERVRFLDWYVNIDELYASFPQYRALVLPSLEDANGLVVQEAMACGLPPICLDWGGPQLLIQHGVSGFLIEPSCKDEITASIAKHLVALCIDANLAERISKAARQAADEWQWSKVANGWLSQYEEAITRRAV
jgi:glycosyltransferase involved in cell wall biosynthesis